MACLFSAFSVPEISISDYVARMEQYAEIHSTTLLCGLIYIDRVLACSDNLKLSFFTVHRLLLVATMLAAKFAEDSHFNNNHWAKVGGVPLSELNELELMFCSALKFSFFIKQEQFNLYSKRLKDFRPEAVTPISPKVHSRRVPELQPGEVLTVFDAEEQEDVIAVKNKDLKCKERTSPMSVVEDVQSDEDQCTPVELDRSPPRIRRRLSVFSF